MHLAVRYLGKPVAMIECLILLKPFLIADGNVISLHDCTDSDAVFSEGLDKERKEHIAQLIEAERKHLYDQNILKKIDREPREGIRLAEDDAAAVKIIAHDRFTVINGIAYAAKIKILIKPVVSVA